MIMRLGNRRDNAAAGETGGYYIPSRMRREQVYLRKIATDREYHRGGSVQEDISQP